MIYINDNLRIRKLDEQCLELEVYRKAKSKKTGEETTQWKGCGYYGDIKSALNGAFKKQLFDSAENETTIKELIALIEQVEKEIFNIKIEE